MKTRTTRIAAIGLTGVLAFGLTACADDAEDEGTTVVEEEAPAEGDDTDVTVEDEEDTGTTDTSTEDTATDTSTEDAATDTATEDAEG